MLRTLNVTTDDGNTYKLGLDYTPHPVLMFRRIKLQCLITYPDGKMFNVYGIENLLLLLHKLGIREQTFERLLYAFCNT